MKKLLFLLLIPGALHVRAQAVNTVTAATPLGVTQAIDSLVKTMDSCVTHVTLAPAAGMYTIDTLTLPPNSAGMFHLIYIAWDTVGKFWGIGSQDVYLVRIGNVYQNPYPENIDPYVTSGLSTHQIYFWVGLLNGLAVARGSGFATTNPIRWHLFRDARITPL